jgi:dihydroorotase
MRILIRGAHLLDPANRIDGIADLLIDSGRVVETGQNLTCPDAEVIDGVGKVLTPGLVDIHAHLREPGRQHKETILTGARAAAAGGFTAVCAMPNTLPAMDSAEVLDFFNAKAKEAPVRCFPIAAITEGLKGAKLTCAASLKENGAVALSDDGEPVTNSRLLYESMLESLDHGLPVVCHSEDKNLAGKGAMHEGYRSKLLGIPGIPGAAEDAAVARDLALATATGAHVHIAHVSTALSLELIRQARQSGARVTCEVSPHHLTLTHDCVDAGNTNTKMNPPLRTREDMEALRRGLQDGSIDCIATDHAPHHEDEKSAPYTEAPFGIVGLETALPVMITELVSKGMLSLNRLIELMTVRPARILDLPCGELIPGGLADLTMIDLNLTKEVEPKSFYSKGKNTPFAGRVLRGWPVLTVVDGRIVMKDGVVHDQD